jgi:predicted Ser/Thr protein kinase
MKTTKLVTGFLGALIISLIVVNSVSAFQGRQKENFNPERFEAMKEVLENRDFEGWKALKQEQCQARFQNMTEEEFNEMAEIKLERMNHMEEIRQAIEKGDHEKLREIKKEFGQRKGFGKMRGKGNRFME